MKIALLYFIRLYYCSWTFIRTKIDDLTVTISWSLSESVNFYFFFIPGLDFLSVSCHGWLIMLAMMASKPYLNQHVFPPLRSYLRTSSLQLRRHSQVTYLFYLNPSSWIERRVKTFIILKIFRSCRYRVSHKTSLLLSTATFTKSPDSFYFIDAN